MIAMAKDLTKVANDVKALKQNPLSTPSHGQKRPRHNISPELMDSSEDVESCCAGLHSLKAQLDRIENHCSNFNENVAKKSYSEVMAGSSLGFTAQPPQRKYEKQITFVVTKNNDGVPLTVKQSSKKS